MTREEATLVCATCETRRTCQSSMRKKFETTFQKQWNELCEYLRKKWGYYNDGETAAPTD